MSHNAIGLLKANGQIDEYANTSGGGSGIEWITKEQWDAMTPEQQSTGTYGVQGLGKENDNVIRVSLMETASVRSFEGSIKTMISSIKNYLNNNSIDITKNYVFDCCITRTGQDTDYYLVDLFGNLSAHRGIFFGNVGWNIYKSISGRILISNNDSETYCDVYSIDTHVTISLA